MADYSRQALEDALPDYLHGVAPAPVAQAIESLAETDSDFASVLAAERRIAAAMSASQEFELDRAAQHDFTRLKARIRSEERPAWQSWLKSIARPIPALAAALVVAVGLFVLPEENNEFRTASDGSAPVAGQIRVIFEAELTVPELQQFERRYSLQREAGPDTAGSYLFSVDESQEIADVVTRLREDTSLTFVGESE